MRHINEVIVHCSATRPNWYAGKSFAEKVVEIGRWHVEERGWRAIGYHWVIGRNGELAAGRPEHAVGAHTKGHNANSIGVCLLGAHGSSAHDEFSEHFTDEQRKTLLKLLDEIEGRYGKLGVSGHNYYANKACPGFDVHQFLQAFGPKPDMAQIEEPAEETGGFWASLLQLIARIWK